MSALIITTFTDDGSFAKQDANNSKTPVDVWTSPGLNNPGHPSWYSNEVGVPNISGNSISRINAANGSLNGTVTAGLSSPIGISTSTLYHYVADRGNNRVIRFNLDWTNPTVVATGISDLRDITADQNFIVVLCSNGGNPAVRVFDTAGIEQGYSPWFYATFNNPIGICMNADNNVFITNTNLHQFIRFTLAGQNHSVFGSQGTIYGQFQMPYGIDVNPNTYSYVVDRANYRAQIFNFQGQFLGTFGSQGNGNSQFQGAFGITTDTQGSVYVTDNINNTLQKFTQQ